jgi:hypothetical protein
MDAFKDAIIALQGPVIFTGGLGQVSAVDINLY